MFLSFFEKIQRVHLLQACLEACCTTNLRCSEQFCSNFFTSKGLFWGCILFWRSKWAFWTSTTLNFSNFFLLFSSSSSFFVKFKTRRFKRWENWKKWKWKAVKFSRKYNRIVQSSTQENMNSVLVHSCNIIEVHCRYMMEMLQHHHVVLHVFWIFWSSNLHTRSTSLNNQWFYQMEVFASPRSRWF